MDLSFIQSLFELPVSLNKNVIEIAAESNALAANQHQTEQIFSDKWEFSDHIPEINRLYEFQYNWFLELYGFKSEDDLKTYLKSKKVIVDAGCGLGYKAAWFAKLAPHATVIGIDISEAAYIAAKNNSELTNLFFLRSDIARTNICASSIDFVVCDQVIMHTENPNITFKHLSDITKPGEEFACYVYAKKALPRELVDDYFRNATHDIKAEEMWQFSEQLTELGKRLHNLNIEFESPDIPLLGIKGGKYNIQRFIYWNFLKCFWREEWGFELSKITNFDWYAPSNAKRYSKDEFLTLCYDNDLIINFFHEEEACYSGRFQRKNDI